jgi:hypothetical protein
MLVGKGDQIYEAGPFNLAPRSDVHYFTEVLHGLDKVRRFLVSGVGDDT